MDEVQSSFRVGTIQFGTSSKVDILPRCFQYKPEETQPHMDKVRPSNLNSGFAGSDVGGRVIYFLPCLLACNLMVNPDLASEVLGWQKLHSALHPVQCRARSAACGEEWRSCSVKQISMQSIPQRNSKTFRGLQNQTLPDSKYWNAFETEDKTCLRHFRRSIVQQCSRFGGTPRRGGATERRCTIQSKRSSEIVRLVLGWPWSAAPMAPRFDICIMCFVGRTVLC